MEQFSWFDIITLGLIAILAIKGIINGFIKEVFGLIGIIGGIYIASRYASQAGEWIDANLFAFTNKGSLFLIGFLALLIAVWILSIFLGYIFSKMLSLSGLGALDKLAGFVVGGAKVFLVFSILFVTVSNINFVQENLNKFLKNSFMYPIFIQAGNYIVTANQNKVPSLEKIKNIDINTSAKSIVSEVNSTKEVDP